MMSRIPHKPTDALRKQVETFASYGVPEYDIASVLSIDAKTLRKHYSTELSTGHIKANALVAQNLFTIARGQGREAVTAAIFWLKARAGWRDGNVAVADKPGKKESAYLMAQEAERGTDWDKLLN